MSVTMTNPTWYDLLNIEPDASTDEIRAAWKTAIADLEPTDRRFRTLNDAAAVLLDKDKREAYDAEIAVAEEAEADVAEDEGGDDQADGKADAESDGVEKIDETTKSTDADGDAADTADVDTADTADPTSAEVPPARTPRQGLPQLPVWALAAVGVLAAASLIAALVLFFNQSDVVTVSNDNTTTSTNEGEVGKAITKNHTLTVEKDASDALEAAKKSIQPLLSYDYQSMPASKAKAHKVMTTSYAKKYDQLFQLLVSNVPNTKTVVKALAPVDAGVVRAGDNRVQVLVIVDENVTNAQTSQPVGSQVFATLTMEKVGGKWLVDNVETTHSQDQ